MRSPAAVPSGSDSSSASSVINDGDHRALEWLSLCPSSATLSGEARTRPSQATNESGTNDGSRRICVGFASGAARSSLASEASDPSVIESTTHLGCLLEPAGDGVPGNPFDPGNRGNADTLDSESDDPIESSSSMLETVVGRAFRRRERLSALAAPVSTAFPGPRSVESVVNNASGTDCSIRRTCGIETSAILKPRHL